ncbi:MAG: hypothetical protein CMI24_08495 [Opitutae bacterium]|nr:hypothetical protein [Opitutae bacterium]MEC8419673.1 hypothetical protein [Verrucomicrobiota bacterium]|tara:strand:- start:416 stop:1072 length:657 start_codon:yes stop_codon:yes gene_type:complete
MNIKPAFISAISVVLSAIVAGVMFFLNKDILKPPPKEEAVFTSIEFDADDTSYSPAETHSMNQLSKELAALKDKLLEREKELDARESAITMELSSLEKQKQELSSLQDEVVKKLEDFENSQGDDLSEEQERQYKDTARRWIEMGPDVASIEIQSWRQNRRFDEALSIFETLKPDEKAPIIAFMYNSDEDILIELADALSMRDRGLLPSADAANIPFQN